MFNHSRTPQANYENQIQNWDMSDIISPSVIRGNKIQKNLKYWRHSFRRIMNKLRNIR